MCCLGKCVIWKICIIQRADAMLYVDLLGIYWESDLSLRNAGNAGDDGQVVNCYNIPVNSVVFLTPAYSEYIQQHYPVLSEQPAEYVSERPPLPDYHTATTTSAHRMLPPRQAPQHGRSRSYDVAYFEPDGKRACTVYRS